MRNLILIFLILNTSVILSQEKLQLVTSLSGSFEKEIISNSANQLYGGIGLDVGLRFNRNNGSIDVLLNYQFSSNVTYRHPHDSVYIDLDNKKTEHYDAEGNRIRFPFKSLLRSHFVGLSLKYNFN